MTTPATATTSITTKNIIPFVTSPLINFFNAMKIRGLMSKIDSGISAGGSTLYDKNRDIIIMVIS